MIKSDTFIAIVAAPLMMTGVQFAIQNLLARLVLRLGIVQRSANAVELDWHQYSRQGLLMQTCYHSFCRVSISLDAHIH